MTLVALAPHLDDAALSAGATLLTAAANGERVVVVTVFTEGAGAATRRAEDARALAMLGVEGLHLHLLDAPERLGLARTTRALSVDAVVDPSDVEITRRALADALAKLSPSRVLAPLAVGRHVDHRVVFEAARAADLPGLSYYEDRPYAFVKGATEARLAELGPLTQRTMTYDADVAERARSAVLAYASQVPSLVDAFGQAITHGIHTETFFVPPAAAGPPKAHVKA